MYVLMEVVLPLVMAGVALVGVWWVCWDIERRRRDDDSGPV